MNFNNKYKARPWAFNFTKNAIKFIIFYFINLLIRPNKKIKIKTLLIIRLDEIGDYILFRNYLEIISRSEQYRNYKIHILGNSSWKNLSESLDRKFIDKFIWLNTKKFNKNIFYRFTKLTEITSNSYEVILSPVFSRNFYLSDNIIKLLSAKKKIGSEGDLTNITKWQKNLGDKYYTSLLPGSSEIIFEFDRNKEFFENLLSTNINLNNLSFTLNIKNKSSFNAPNAILFIGASSKYRQWSMKSFAKVANYLKKYHDYKIILCGGLNEIEKAREFNEYFNEDFVDLVGKTSLLELLSVINESGLLVSNDSCAPHLTVALQRFNIKIFVVSNGHTFGRFTPYPKKMYSNYFPIYHPKVQKDINNYKKLTKTYGFGSNLNINDINSKDVIARLEEVLNES
jgi:ADP-heptose:LPS heptosyltransferase